MNLPTKSHGYTNKMFNYQQVTVNKTPKVQKR